MRSRIHGVVIPSEVGDFAEEIQRIFLELGRTFGAESLAGECSPAIDVFETDDTLELTVDVPGIEPSALRVLMKADAVLLVGEKTARRGHRESSFHLVERDFGHFARAVRLGRACDAAKARASLANGELRISIPKIDDRRGQTMEISVKAGEAG
jgi:HSP20 family protein